MRLTPPSAAAIVPVMLALLLAPAGLRSASGQGSTADLRRENERLRAENEALRREVERLSAERDRLEARVLELERGVASEPERPADSSAPEKPAPVPAIDPGVFASPRTMTAFAQARYREEFDARPLDFTGPDAAVELRRLEDWRRRTERQLMGRVDWRARIVSISRDGAALRVELDLLESTGERVIGERVTTTVSRAVARALDAMDRRGDLDTPVVVRGLARGTLLVNPEREKVGPFDRPPFVGRFIEFGVILDIQNVGRLRPEPSGG